MTEQHARYNLADSAFTDILERTHTLVIAGCGLLGTSVARAFREQFAGEGPAKIRIVGIESNPVALAEAQTLSHPEAGPVYDQVCSSVAQLNLEAAADALEHPVISVVATPPAFIPEAVRELAPLCTLVMDVGSIKAPIVDALASRVANFVPCHPMAGSHRQGPASGSADLFVDRWVFVVASTGASTDLTALAHAFWQSLGARTQEIDPKVHDQAVAYTSHLPHLLASAYMAVDSPDVAAAGTGFMEFTRLAKSNPEMWSQVLHANQAAWRPLLAGYIESLQALETLIEQGDIEAIKTYLSARRDERFALDIPADEARSLL